MSDDNKSFHEEDSLGKVYDSRLMKRLLVYASKYWRFFVIAVIMLIASTAVDLARPYLLKVVIDDHLKGYTDPMVRFPENSGIEGINHDKWTYKKINMEDVQNNDPVFSIIYFKKTPYLLKNYISGSNNSNLNSTQIEESDGEFSLILTIDGIEYEGKQLDKKSIKAFRANDIKSTKNIGLLLIVLILFGFAFNYIQILILSRTGQTIIYNIRQEVFSHLQKLPLKYFDKNPVGRLVTRVTNDTETLNEMYTSVLVMLLKDVLILIGAVAIMFKMSSSLALITISVLPLVIAVTIVFRIKARGVYRKVRTTLARINSSLSENLSGIKIIQVFGKHRENFKEFKRVNHMHYKAGIQQTIVFGIFRPIIEMLSYMIIAVIIWYGGGRVLDGIIKFGVLFAFINYIGQFFQPINDLAEKYNIMQSAMASSERIFNILDDKPEPDSGTECPSIDTYKGDIEFKDVWFAYNNEDWVLKDISFKIPAGKTIAIVGATGAGKTSIINLLGRLYEIQKGNIEINGIDIKNIKKQCLRSNIGIVLQDVFLFSGTIKDNIKLNNDNITDDQVIDASKHVNADSFIERLPLSYEDEVKERGATYSSGQRQLLAFARALAFNPSILILDEATSNIDTETELLIQNALSKLTKNRTNLIIAHRLSTIQHADGIIVLHNGRIKETGTHNELISRKGFYYNLYKLQYADI